MAESADNMEGPTDISINNMEREAQNCVPVYWYRRLGCKRID